MGHPMSPVLGQFDVLSVGLSRAYQRTPPPAAPRMSPNGPVMNMPSTGAQLAGSLRVKRSGPHKAAENPIPPTTKAPSRTEPRKLAGGDAVCVHTYHATPAATSREPRKLIQKGR